MRRRALSGAVIAVAALAAFAGPAAAAAILGNAEARMPAFPQRAYVLTLPEAQALGRAQLSVTERSQKEWRQTARRQAKPHFRDREARFLRGNCHVAAGDQRTTRADGRALHHADYGFG